MRSASHCRNDLETTAETLRAVITATAIFRKPSLEVFRRADIMASRRATQNVNSSHKQVGRPGLEPGTNALKGRCSTD
jgi:hypothetical protein